MGSFRMWRTIVGDGESEGVLRAGEARCHREGRLCQQEHPQSSHRQSETGKRDKVCVGVKLNGWVYFHSVLENRTVGSTHQTVMCEIGILNIRRGGNRPLLHTHTNCMLFECALKHYLTALTTREKKIDRKS